MGKSGISTSRAGSDQANIHTQPTCAGPRRPQVHIAKDGTRVHASAWMGSAMFGRGLHTKQESRPAGTTRASGACRPIEKLLQLRWGEVGHDRHLSTQGVGHHLGEGNAHGLVHFVTGRADGLRGSQETVAALKSRTTTKTTGAEQVRGAHTKQGRQGPKQSSAETGDHPINPNLTVSRNSKVWP